MAIDSVNLAEWAFRQKNIFIGGGTQQGKSVLANQIMAEDDRIGVFFNHDDESFVVGKEVRSFSGIVEGLQQGYDTFNFTMDPFDLDVADRHEALTMALMKAGENHGMQTTLVTDEAHEVGTEGKQKTSLHLANKRGLKRGVRNLNLTQDPSALSKSIVRQCDYFAWVGPPSKFDISYMTDKKIPVEPFKSNSDHEFTAIDKSGNVVQSGFANAERYSD